MTPIVSQNNTKTTVGNLTNTPTKFTLPSINVKAVNIEDEYGSNNDY
jgi:hypothetical protein